jgi:uncharacterized membrane protein YfcA
MSASMDLFDLTLVIAAVIFHLSIVGVYITQKNGRDKLVKAFGAVTLLLGAPLAVIFGHYIISGEPEWKLNSFGFIFLYLLTELLLDFVFKIDFRKKLVPHTLYIILFYVAIIGFIRMSFAVNTYWGYAVSVAFWILLGALIYNLAGQRKGKQPRIG